MIKAGVQIAQVRQAEALATVTKSKAAAHYDINSGLIVIY